MVSTLTRRSTKSNPKLPIKMHSVGKAGWNHRYYAEYITGVANGEDVNTWADITLSKDFVVPASTDAPTLLIEDGKKWVRFDGVDDGLRASIATGTVKTVAMWVRVQKTAGQVSLLISGNNTIVLRGATNNVSVTVTLTNSGSATSGTPTSSMTTGPARLVVLSEDGLNTRVYVNGVSSGTLTGTLLSSAMAALLIGKGGSTFGQNDYREIVTWPDAATPAEVAQITSDLLAFHAA